jgi:hypothetical protein
MEKINLPCDIIQDLIPLYADNVCSEKTRECVNEHISTCRDCRQMLELCRDSEFSGKELEKREVDGFKKLRRKFKMTDLISAFLILFIVVLRVYSGEFNCSQIPSYLYYGSFFVCMIGVFLLTLNKNAAVKMQRKDIVFAVLSALGCLYTAFLMVYCIQTCAAGKIPFGIETQRVGEFIHVQLMFVLVLQLVILVVMLVRLSKKNINCGVITGLNLTGIFLVLGYDSLLHRLDTYESFLGNFTRTSLATAVVGLLGIAVLYLLSKRKY